MSDDHDHEAKTPASTGDPRDPRLDASGAEHPQVRPSSFDLLALEHTRSGLRLLGLGLAGWSLAHPLVAQMLAEYTRITASTGWVLNALSLLCLIAAVLVAAPTPHGPLPRFLGWAFVLVFLADLAASVLHLFVLQGASLDSESMLRAVRWVDNSARVACLLLPWILWRFCQFRGLAGRAIVWLWFAMASSGLALAVTFSEMRWLLYLFPPLGVIAFFAAQHTARDVWLDAVYRHTRFYVVPDKSRTVEPLRPANER